MYCRLSILGVTASLFAYPLHAEDLPSTGEVVVTGTRADEPVALEDYAGSATVISPEQLENRQVREIGEALRDVPGVAVNEVPGQTQIRLRGSEANQVLVLVDGIEVSDPFAGEFDIATLQAEIGSRLEVIRGPQSALYGSDAIGGVISYQTASGRSLPGVQASAEGGSFGTLNAAVRGGFASENFDLALGANALTSDGTPNARGGSRNLARDSWTLSGKTNWQPVDGLALRAAGRYVSTKGEYNDPDYDPASPTFGYIVDTPGLSYANEATYALIGANVETLGGRWTHDLSGQIADVSRDAYSYDARLFGSEGQRLKASYVSDLRFVGAGLSHAVILAADLEREEYRNTDPFGSAFTGKRSASNFGIAGEYRLKGAGFDLSGSIRRDFNNRFADATTFRVAGGVDIGATTRVRAAIGSGIKNPGFYELYGYFDGRFIGNADLKPEKSTGWEAGIDQSFGDGAVMLSATWFDATLRNEIYTDYPAPDYVATPANRTTRSTRQGLELAAAVRLGEAWSLDAAYTYLDAEEDGLREVRRPRHSGSIAVTWHAPKDAASATLVVRQNGAMDDLAYTDPSYVPVRERLGAYTLVTFAADAPVARGITLYGRVENALDQRYEQVFSFVSPGRSAILGLRAEL